MILVVEEMSWSMLKFVLPFNKMLLKYVFKLPCFMQSLNFNVIYFDTFPGPILSTFGLTFINL